MVWNVLIFLPFAISVTSMVVTFAGRVGTGSAERVVVGHAWAGLVLAIVAIGLVVYGYVGWRAGTAPGEREWLDAGRLAMIRFGEWTLMLVAVGPAVIAVLTVVIAGTTPSEGAS